MTQPLAVTSSDHAAGCLRRAGITDDVLAWFDPLHIGPVPAREDLDTLSAHRASFFQLQSFGFSRVGHDYFKARNARLLEAAATTDIVLVFQDNMLDQLQQLQVLDALDSIKNRSGGLLAVHARGFIDELSEQDTLALAEKAHDITPEALELARVAWDAYRQPTPEAWADLALYDMSSLPFLEQTIKRALEELPAPGSGLSRSQRQVLELLRRKSMTPRDLYHAHFQLEPSSHLEDWVMYAMLDGMAEGTYPLIEGKSDVAFNPNMALIDWQRYIRGEIKVTSYGQAVLRGETDDRQHNGTDHWWGGTHLTDSNHWRWDPKGGQLVPPGVSAPMSSKAPVETAQAPPLNTGKARTPSESAA